MPLPLIAITLGDPAGIGPEIALKAALDRRVRALCRPLLVGDRFVLDLQARHCGLAGRLAEIELIEVRTEAPALGETRAAHGRAAIDAARAAIDLALRGSVDAVVAAPQTERAIKLAGIDFDGYPSFVARLSGLPVDDVFLMLCFDRARIVHATLHVSLRQAIALITRKRIGKAIAAAEAALRRLGSPRPRLAVAGLNPHAGEDGLFGSEESEIIGPAIAAARGAGVDVDGPFGADTLFQRPGYDAVIVMYHDQGHVAAKLQAPNRAAGLAIGAPVLFSSVAHGSALDIAGQNRASPEAMIAAITLLAGVTSRVVEEER
jgi:4-hydroxythreonine-4-phosphate dehydrogenase